MTIALIVAIVALVVVTLMGEREPASWRVWPKAAASVGFIVLALVSRATDTAYGKWVLVALALGWVGDVALTLRRPAWFMVGLAAFLMSHLAYVAAFQVHGLRAIATTVTLGLLLLVAGVVGRWLLPHVPRDMQVPVIAYIAVITVMVAAATGAASDGAPWPVLPAAVLFFLSDLAVARDRFVNPGIPNRIVGLPMYYAAQILFAASTGMV